ncbi:MAG: Nudix hydrolase 3 [Parcubacteria group bacterium GW2011_GWC2_45_7]|nr:MAG: Nudix hydrolase 3 [Parcubacteria group bacterium GW2011_GWC2_45_7]
MSRDQFQELFYLVDKNDKRLGSVFRHQAHSDSSKIHRSICVIGINTKNQILFQKRSQSKDTFPCFWTLSVTGHVVFGETYLKAARRELLEELGIKSELKFIKKILLCLPSETEFCSIYETAISAGKINHDSDEIITTRWIGFSQLDAFTNKNNLTPDALQILLVLKYF